MRLLTQAELLNSVVFCIKNYKSTVYLILIVSYSFSYSLLIISLKADLSIWGLFICDFVYVQLKIVLFIKHILFIVILGLFICEFIICDPYPSHVTRSPCISKSLTPWHIFTVGHPWSANNGLNGHATVHTAPRITWKSKHNWC